MLIDTSKTERLDHPHEEAWVEIRPVLATELDAARDRKIKSILDIWGDVIKDAPTPSKRQEDMGSRVQQFDSTILLNAAIANWSYDAPVNAENVAKLDGVTRDWLMEEVVTRNTRPLTRSKGSDKS